MESLNQTLFLWLNAPEHPSALALTLAVFFAERLIWAMPLVIGIGWPTTPAQASGDDSSSPETLWNHSTKHCFSGLTHRSTPALWR